MKYQLENATSKNIQIVAFYNSQLLDSIILNPHSIFEKETQMAGKNAETYIFNSQKNGGIRDSVVIIYDNSVYKVQFCGSRRDLSSCENIENKIGLGYMFPHESDEIQRSLFRKRYKYPYKIIFTESYFKDAVLLGAK